MQIALIDDGIDTSMFKELRLRAVFSVGENGTISELGADERIVTDHGTTCAGIIAKYAPEAEFYVLRIFRGVKLNASCIQLVSALKWCLNAKVPIVHMSIGSSVINDYWEIRQVVARMLRQCQVIVAAHSNRTPYSMPACLSGVLGVKADENLMDNEYVFSGDMSQYTIYASSRHELVTSFGSWFVTQVSNSYAAPTLTAAVHCILSSYDPFSLTSPQIQSLLAKEHWRQRYMKPDFIEDAVIVNPGRFPILKQHLFFKCIGEYVELSGINNSDNNYDVIYLKSRDSFDNEAGVSELERNSGIYGGLLYGGKLPHDNSMFFRSGFFWSENACHEILRMYSAAIPNGYFPVVNIHGCGSRPVDAMCRLRSLFVKEGYQCVCISSYPFSYLYGMEYIPTADSKNAALAYVHHFYDPDLAICYCGESRCHPEENADEYYIDVCLDDDNVYGAVNSCANQSIIPSAFNGKDILSLYNRIVRYFP